jgi:hypothetical protein
MWLLSRLAVKPERSARPARDEDVRSNCVGHIIQESPVNPVLA